MAISYRLYFQDSNTSFPILSPIFSFYFYIQERISGTSHDHRYLLTCIWALILYLLFYRFFLPLCCAKSPIIFSLLRDIVLAILLSSVSSVSLSKADYYFLPHNLKTENETEPFPCPVIAPQVSFPLHLNLLRESSISAISYFFHTLSLDSLQIIQDNSWPA